MSLIAAIRPEEWNLPLFLHVLGAFALVGALVTSGAFLVAAQRESSAVFARLGYRALLLGALPSYLVMRVAAQWIANEEGLEDSDAAWITFGYASTEGGLLFMVAATVAAGLAVRKQGQSRAAVWIVSGLAVLYLAAIVIMATKPD